MGSNLAQPGGQLPGAHHSDAGMGEQGLWQLTWFDSIYHISDTWALQGCDWVLHFREEGHYRTEWVSVRFHCWDLSKPRNVYLRTLDPDTQWQGITVLMLWNEPCGDYSAVHRSGLFLHVWEWSVAKKGGAGWFLCISLLSNWRWSLYNHCSTWETVWGCLSSKRNRTCRSQMEQKLLRVLSNGKLYTWNIYVQGSLEQLKYILHKVTGAYPYFEEQAPKIRSKYFNSMKYSG